MISNFQKECFSKNLLIALAHIGHLLLNFTLITPYPVLVASYLFFYFTYPYVRAGVLLSLTRLTTLGISIFRGPPLVLIPYFKYQLTIRF